MTVDLEALEALAAETDSSTSSPTPPPSSTQRVRLTLEDGTSWDVTLDARDRRAYALNADRYGLPAFTMDPAGSPDVLKLELLTVFSAWWATRHRLNLHAMDWPRFNASLVDLDLEPDVPGVVAHPPDHGAG